MKKSFLNLRQRLFKKPAIALALIMLFTGCNGDGGGGTSSAGDSAAANKITWMAMLHTDNPPSNDIVAKLAEIAGVDSIDFQWVPDASKDEKLNAALAAKKLTHIVSLTTVTDNPPIRRALRDGAFWDVEQYLSEFPNLSKISKERLDAARVNGKIYGVPFQKPIARYGILVRQDWLDNLGLPVPKTIEELLEVARAFSEDDPDGNGIKDTVGLVERKESFNLGFRMLSGYYGAPNYFSVDENGKVQVYFQHEGFYKAAEEIRRLYENGYMNSDWISMEKQPQQEYIARGGGGIVFTGMFDARNYVNIANQTGQSETMKWTMINDIVSEGVERRVLSDTNGGFGGLLAIPKTEVKDEAELRRILAFIDKLCSKEAFLLMTWGVEGVHCAIDENGAYERIDEDKWRQQIQPLAGSRPDEMWTYEIPTVDELQTVSNGKIVENEPFAVYNDCQGLESQTYDREWKMLLPIVQDAYSKYIIGNITMEDFKSEVQRWFDSGGQKIIDEYEASYASINS